MRVYMPEETTEQFCNNFSFSFGVYGDPRAGLEVWLRDHVTIASSLFVVVAASTGVLFYLIFTAPREISGSLYSL